MPPKIISAHELAVVLEASYSDVLCWTRSGLIPSIKAGGRYYYNLARVMEAIRTVKAPEPEASTCGA